MTSPIVAALLVWIAAIIAVLAASALAVYADRRRIPALALPAIVPVAIGAILAISGVGIPAPHPALATLMTVGIAALAVTAGAPLTLLVLDRTAPATVAEGTHGGILVRADAPMRDDETLLAPPPRVVLRGGSIIGYLERFAVVAAIALGRIEVIGAVIAIKGLGRFSELDNGQARERFIIGTLVSLIWASACGALIAAPDLLP